MKHVKLFEEFINEAAKPIIAYDPVRDLPARGYIVIEGEHEVKYWWPSLVMKLKSQGYVPYVNTIGFQGDEHKGSPYHTKLTIGPKQEMDMLSAIKADGGDAHRSYKYSSYSPICVAWRVIEAHDYYGEKVPELRWWRFERNEQRTWNDFKPQIEFRDYFEPKLEFRGLDAGKEYGI